MSPIVTIHYSLVHSSFFTKIKVGGLALYFRLLNKTMRISHCHKVQWSLSLIVII